MLKSLKPDWISHETLTLDGKSVAVNDSAAVSELLCSWLESRSNDVTYAACSEALSKAYFTRKTIVWNRVWRVVSTQIYVEGGDGQKQIVADVLMAMLPNGQLAGREPITIIKIKNQVVKGTGFFTGFWLDLNLQIDGRSLRADVQNPSKPNGSIRAVWSEGDVPTSVLNFEVTGRKDPRRLIYKTDSKTKWQLFLDGRVDKPFKGWANFVNALTGKQMIGWENRDNESFRELPIDTQEAVFLLLAVLLAIYEPEEKMTAG